MKTITTLLLGFILMNPPTHLEAQESEELDLFFKLSDYYFKKYVYNGNVDYQYASKYSGEINAIHDLIARINLDGVTEDEYKAFCANAYNLLVIYQVAKAYPIDNPLNEAGFFDEQEHKVAGKMLTLNELEHEMIAGSYGDARFHFVLACAASSCPELANFAYRPENMEQLMDERTRKTLNELEFVRIDSTHQKVYLSKIFHWYEKDFVGGDDSIIEFINQYRIEKIPANYAIEYSEYNWSLNERRSY